MPASFIWGIPTLKVGGYYAEYFNTTGGIADKATDNNILCL